MAEENCEHKFVHLRNENYYRFTSRYGREYVSIDYFFCEKCLKEMEKKKDIHIADHEVHKLPDWAKSITNKIAGYEY